MWHMDFSGRLISRRCTDVLLPGCFPEAFRVWLVFSVINLQVRRGSIEEINALPLHTPGNHTDKFPCSSFKAAFKRFPRLREGRNNEGGAFWKASPARCFWYGADLKWHTEPFALLWRFRHFGVWVDYRGFLQLHLAWAIPAAPSHLPTHPGQSSWWRV